MAFDWSLYFSLLAKEIRWREDGRIRKVKALEADWPIFRNIAYPLSVTPLVVRSEWHRQQQDNVSRYLALLEKTIRLCVAHTELSDYLGHSETERRFVLTPLHGDRYITICRLDGYLDRDSGELKVLEHNSDSPAGIVFSPRLNSLVRTVWREHGEMVLEQRLAVQQFDDAAHTRNLFASCMSQQGEFVILQEAGKSNVESREMATAFSAAGLTTSVADPQQLQYEDSKVLLDGRPVHVVWNKINTVYWRQYVEQYPQQVEKWLQILNNGSVTHLNHFGARLVTENKRCLSMLQEERFAHLFDAQEHALIRHMLPWASKFEPNKRVEWRGERLEVVQLARQARKSFVIKEPYDIRGDGVTVGLDCSEDQWEEKVQQAMANGWVLQQYVAPLQLPVSSDDSWCSTRNCNLSLDTFLFNGRIAGYGAKASVLHRVNLFKGGQKLAVFIGADDDVYDKAVAVPQP